MKIIVCVRQTPDTEARIQPAADGRSIQAEGLKFVMGPYDEYAHEFAVQVKEGSGATVTAASFGPERVQETLRQCLALGADEAVWIDAAGVEGDDSLATARALAGWIRGQGADLVLTSTRGTDTDRGQVGAALAELLGLPYSGPASEIELDPAAKTALVTRDAEGGREQVRLTLPAVVCVQKGIREPRYASLVNIMKAKKKPITTVSLGDLGLSPAQLAPKVRIEAMTPPPARPPGRKVEGPSVEEKVRELVRLLREEAKVI